MSNPDPLADAEQPQLEPSEAQEGHRETFASLYKENRQSLLRVLRPRCQTPEEAEEILHEALAKLFALDRPGTYSFLSSLLYRTALNLVIDRRRQEATHARLNPIAVKNSEEYAPSPEQAVQEHQFRLRLEEALQALQHENPTWSEAFVLRSQHRWEWQAIADRMGVTPRMTQFYVARAVEYCQAYIDSKVTRRKPK